MTDRTIALVHADADPLTLAHLLDSAVLLLRTHCGDAATVLVPPTHAAPCEARVSALDPSGAILSVRVVAPEPFVALTIPASEVQDGDGIRFPDGTVGAVQHVGTFGDTVEFTLHDPEDPSPAPQVNPAPDAWVKVVRTRVDF